MDKPIEIGRILGLDVGDARIGFSLSDEEAFLATGLPTLKRIRLEKDVETIADLVSDRGAVAVVVGLPINMNGTLGPQAEKVMKLKNCLDERLEVPVFIWDERLTTVEAERIMLESDLSRKKRRKVIDRLSAEIILQSFIDCLHIDPQSIQDQQTWMNEGRFHV